MIHRTYSAPYEVEIIELAQHSLSVNLRLLQIRIGEPFAHFGSKDVNLLRALAEAYSVIASRIDPNNEQNFEGIEWDGAMTSAWLTVCGEKQSRLPSCFWFPQALEGWRNRYTGEGPRHDGAEARQISAALSEMADFLTLQAVYSLPAGLRHEVFLEATGDVVSA